MEAGFISYTHPFSIDTMNNAESNLFLRDPTKKSNPFACPDASSFRRGFDPADHANISATITA
jgi:hypothetical protein